MSWPGPTRRSSPGTGSGGAGETGPVAAVRRSELSPARDDELRNQGARRDVTGRFLVVDEEVPESIARPCIRLHFDGFTVVATLPAGKGRELDAAMREGMWKATDRPDEYTAGVYRLSRVHAVLVETGMPVVWDTRGADTTKLTHYQDQAGGDVLVLLERHEPDAYLPKLFIEGAKHTWLLGEHLLMMGPPAYNKTIASLGMEGAECVYDPDLLGRAEGDPAQTGGRSAWPSVAKDMVANPCRFQVLEAPVHRLRELAARFDRVGTREADTWLVPRAEAVVLVDELRAEGVELVTRRLDGRRRDYEQWSPELPEDTGWGRPQPREPVTDLELPGPVPGLRSHTVLDDHQVRGAAYILAREHCCVLGDEMGLGKTLTAVAAAQFLDGPKIVVCPASARQVWEDEVAKWSHATTLVLRPGMDAEEELERLKEDPVDYVVVSYDGMARFQETIAGIDWSLAILDEAHYLRNRRTRRVQLARELLLRVPRRLLLTGTPLMNDPVELRSLLYFVAPDEWEDAAWFRARFGRPFEMGTEEVREQVVQKLHEYLDDVMVRRVKSDVFHALPEKNTHVHQVDLTTAWRREYAEEEAQYVSDHDSDPSHGWAMARLNRLRQLTVNGKLDDVMPALRDLLDAGEKVVVFGFFLNGLETLKVELAEYNPVMLTGASTDRQRDAVVRQFQEDDECRLFLGQVHAAGQAITLTAARHVAFLDLVWNPSVMRQAMDRVHRRGQDRDVHVHFFITYDTVEEDLRDVLEQKAAMVDAVVDDIQFRDSESVQWEVTQRLLERAGGRKE